MNKGKTCMSSSQTKNEPHREKKTTDFCLCENKVADQLRSNCEADQRLCFRYTDGTVLPKIFSAKNSIFALECITIFIFTFHCYLASSLRIR